MAALPLEPEIRRRIEVAGPMPVGQYMSLCLAHPEHGYYITRDPLGRDGDFTTAPEITALFGATVAFRLEADRVDEAVDHRFTNYRRDEFAEPVVGVEIDRLEANLLRMC